MKKNRILKQALGFAALTAAALAMNARADDTDFHPQQYLHVVQKLAMKTLVVYAAQEGFQQKSPVGLALSSYEARLGIGKYSTNFADYAGVVQANVIDIVNKRTTVSVRCRVQSKTRYMPASKPGPRPGDGMVLASNGHGEYLLLKQDTTCEIAH